MNNKCSFSAKYFLYRSLRKMRENELTLVIQTKNHLFCIYRRLRFEWSYLKVLFGNFTFEALALVRFVCGNQKIGKSGHSVDVHHCYHIGYAAAFFN